MPTFCVLVASISLMAFMGLVAYDVEPIGVLAIGIVVFLVMTLQFIVYGTHQCATSASRVCRAGVVSMLKVVQR